MCGALAGAQLGNAARGAGGLIGVAGVVAAAVVGDGGAGRRGGLVVGVRDDRRRRGADGADGHEYPGRGPAQAAVRMGRSHIGHLLVRCCADVCRPSLKGQHADRGWVQAVRRQ